MSPVRPRPPRWRPRTLERAFWSAHSRTWDDLLATGTTSRHIEEVADWFASVLSNDGEVADLGCGTGNFALALGERGVRVVGVDFALGMLRRADGKRRERGIECVRFRRADLSRPLEFPDGSLAGALSVYSLQLVHPEALLAEVRRVLRPRGYVLVVAPCPSGKLRLELPAIPLSHRLFLVMKRVGAAVGRRAGLVRHFHLAELRALLLEAGFMVVEERQFTRSTGVLARAP